MKLPEGIEFTREWRVAGNYRYSVSNDGLVKNNKSGRILSPGVVRGYFCVTLSKGSLRATVRVHRLVAALFLGKCPVGMQVNHKDGNKQNNRIENLEYVTPQGNTIHAWSKNLCSGNSKNTKAQVLEIRKLTARGASRKALAKKFKLDISSICDIHTRRTWKKVL